MFYVILMQRLTPHTKGEQQSITSVDMMFFFSLTSLWWLAHELTGCTIIIEILHWVISPFIYSCADHTGNPFPAADVSQGLKWAALFLGRQNTFPYKYKCGSQCQPWLHPVVPPWPVESRYPGNPWALLIFRVNNMTLWARKLLLLTLP